MPEHQPGCPTMIFAADDQLAQRLGLGAAALRYLKLGYRVLPLQRGGKKPHRMLPEHGGVHLATSYPSQVWEWWKQDPAANVGIACGQQSQLVVIDLDVKRGQMGPAVFAHFLREHGWLDGWPAGPWVKTPSGGVHLWVRTKDPVPERPGILPGVDIKAAGGLVVAPPSMSLAHPASRPGDAAGVAVPVPLPYMWEGCPCQVPLAPDWLTEWAHTAPTQGTQRSVEEIKTVAIEELRKDGIEPGSRNVIMYQAACSL